MIYLASDIQKTFKQQLCSNKPKVYNASQEIRNNSDLMTLQECNIVKILRFSLQYSPYFCNFYYVIFSPYTIGYTWCGVHEKQNNQCNSHIILHDARRELYNHPDFGIDERATN